MDQRREHRLCPRYTFRVPVRFRVLDLEFGIFEQMVESVNVSRNGLYLTSRLALPVGKKIYMKLSMPVEVPAQTHLRESSDSAREQNSECLESQKSVRLRPASTSLDLAPSLSRECFDDGDILQQVRWQAVALF